MLSKLLVLSILFASVLEAEYLLQQGGSNYMCVNKYWYDRPDTYYVRSDSPNTVRSTGSKTVFTSGFEYQNGNCQKLEILEKTGMTYEDYNYLMSLLGLLTAFTFLFFGSYLVIEIARK